VGACGASTSSLTAPSRGPSPPSCASASPAADCHGRRRTCDSVRAFRRLTQDASDQRSKHTLKPPPPHKDDPLSPPPLYPSRPPPPCPPGPHLSLQLHDKDSLPLPGLRRLVARLLELRGQAIGPCASLIPRSARLGQLPIRRLEVLLQHEDALQGWTGETGPNQENSERPEQQPSHPPPRGPSPPPPPKPCEKRLTPPRSSGITAWVIILHHNRPRSCMQHQILSQDHSQLLETTYPRVAPGVCGRARGPGPTPGRVGPAAPAAPCSSTPAGPAPPAAP
jgi:hypothetical protein